MSIELKSLETRCSLMALISVIYITNGRGNQCEYGFFVGKFRQLQIRRFQTSGLAFRLEILSFCFKHEKKVHEDSKCTD